MSNFNPRRLRRDKHMLTGLALIWIKPRYSPLWLKSGALHCAIGVSALPPRKRDINASLIDVLKRRALRSSSTIGGCDRKPLNSAARDRVCQKSARAHVSEGAVDQLKAVGALERHGDGLWHPVKVVIQHS